MKLWCYSFLLYFGFNFLKGVNIFSSTNTYYGKYANINGLTEQSPVYVRGYKVGQVDKIFYDFSSADAFVVEFSINKDIILNEGTELALIADGLLGGSALELQIPSGKTDMVYAKGDTVPTIVIPGLVDNLQNGLLEDLSITVQRADSLIAQVKSQLDNDYIESSLDNVEQLTTSLNKSADAIEKIVKNEVPQITSEAKQAVGDIKKLAANVKDIDVAATMSKVDSVMSDVQEVVASVNSTEGIIGLLLNDKKLYLSINETVNSADSLLTDIKKTPKRYVHFSLFGKKDKK